MAALLLPIRLWRGKHYSRVTAGTGFTERSMTELPIDENTPRILIVEDEPKLGQLLIDYLRAASYAPTLISHGDQVLPYVRQTPPDLICWI